MACILVIDDDPDFRTMLSMRLRHEGHEALEAADGREGMEVFESRAVDLVITDIIMPEKEGSETIRDMLRAAPEIPIIAISGGGRLAPDGFLRIAKALGARSTFAKPIEWPALREAVDGLLAEPSA